MNIHLIPSPFYAANCVVLIPDGEPAALVVDPSAGIQGDIRALLDAYDVQVGGVLLTHGHPDHVWDAAAVASWGADGPVPVWLPSPDMYRMDDPLAYVQLPPPDLALGEWQRPTTVQDMPTGSVELVPGVWIRMIPAPGHSEGSAVFIGHCDMTMNVGGDVSYSSETPVPWALSADVIFRGSVGRTDLPGGDEIQMRHSLRTLANVIDPATILIPGHGPATILSDELTTNPYIIRARQVG